MEGEAPATEAVGQEAPAEVRERKSKNPRWLPLESNPKVLNDFLKRIGAASTWQFIDVIGLDPELLGMVPQPVVAVCMLFPSKPIRKPRRDELAPNIESRKGPASTFFLTQHKDFGNACGTIAAVHVVGNLARSGVMELQPQSAIERFLLAVAGKDPDTVGWELANATELHEVSEAAARSRDAQTRTPERDEKVDGHFVAFVAVEGRLVELDGTMGCPIDHGELTPATSLLAEAARVIRTEFFSRAPGNPLFSVMALVPDVDGPGHVGPGAVSEEQVRNLTAMGFPESMVREALMATGGNADMAAEMLLSG